MADKQERVVVQPREKIERKRSALDRWIDSAAWLERPAKAVPIPKLRWPPRKAPKRTTK